MWKTGPPAGTEMSSQECKVQGLPQNWTLPQGMPDPEKGQTKSQSCSNTTKDDDDTHIDENGVRQPSPPRVNMFKLVNHIEATKGSQGKHLIFLIAKHPKGP